METMTAELQQLLQTYKDSKVIRLGTAWNESDEYGRRALKNESGELYRNLRKYATIAQHYFPKRPKKYAIWTDAEDNFLMGNYQVKTLKQICECLPNRSRNSIIKRASFLGVTKQR
jgi:hypothetical protein